MPVPTSGNFNMFGASNTTIQGAIVEGGGSGASSSTDFNNLKTFATITKFDPTYAGSITNLSQITQSSQFRNYPLPAGSVWATSTVNVVNDLYVGLYDGTKTVACGGFGGIPGNSRIATSTNYLNGYTTRLDISLEQGVIVGIARAPNLASYIAVSQHRPTNSTARLYFSSDGNSWTPTTVSYSGFFSSIATNSNIYCIVGTDGIVTTTDGLNLTNRSSLDPAGITFGINLSPFYSRFVAGGFQFITHSNDGITWSTSTPQVPFNFTNKLFDFFVQVSETGANTVPYGFYAIDRSNAPTSFNLWRSLNGIDNWFLVTTSGASLNFRPYNMRYINNKLYILGTDGNILVSSNGISFTNIKTSLPSIFQSAVLFDIIYDSTNNLMSILTSLPANLVYS